MIRTRHIVPLAAVCTAAGLGAASLASGAKESPRRSRPAAAPIVFGCAPFALPAARAPRGPRTAPPATAPRPSAKLLAAFGVLRRPRAATDTLPHQALARLRASGARFDPGAARLLRTTPRGGRAWIVPVADVGVLDCGPVSVVLAGRARLLPYTSATPAPLLIPARPAVRAPRPFPRSARAVPKRLRPGRPRLYRVRPVPATPAAPVRAAGSGPREGVAVIALGDAPGGGGGSLNQLQRARALPAVEPCSGPGGELVAISGVVPDGVTQAFLTSPDGTAIKTAVTGNAYAFIVPPSRSAQPRYVVWMKQGLPQVSPVAAGLGGLPRGIRCSSARAVTTIRLSPSGALMTALRPLYPFTAIPAAPVATRPLRVPGRGALPRAIPATPATPGPVPVPPRHVAPPAVPPAPKTP